MRENKCCDENWQEYCSICDYWRCYSCQSDDGIFLDKCKECEFVVCSNCDTESYLYDSEVCIYCIRKEIGDTTVEIDQVFQCWQCKHFYIDKDPNICEYGFYTCIKCDTPKKERKDELTEELNKFGLNLREDSILCRKYIQQDEGDLEDIVERMCEMKYLHEYTNFKTIKQQVYEEFVKEEFYIGDGNVFREAESRTISENPYPEIWPWIADKAARVIQKRMMIWLYKLYTKDGKIGLMPMRYMKELGIRDIPSNL